MQPKHQIFPSAKASASQSFTIQVPQTQVSLAKGNSPRVPPLKACVTSYNSLRGQKDLFIPLVNTQMGGESSHCSVRFAVHAVSVLVALAEQQRALWPCTC